MININTISQFCSYYACIIYVSTKKPTYKKVKLTTGKGMSFIEPFLYKRMKGFHETT